MEFFVVEGSGWRGRRSLTPRCSVTPIRCMHWRSWMNIFVIYRVWTTTTTTRVAVQTRGLVVHRFVSCSVRHRVNLFGLPILMATPADGPHEGGMRRREGARVRRERRQRAEARLRLRLVRDAAMLVAHRGGPRFDSQSKFVKEAVPEPVLVSRLLEPSSGVVGPFKHLHVAAQSPVAGAAPLLGDVFWDQPLSLEKLKDLLPSPVSVPVTVPVVAASVPSSVLDQQCNVEESGDVSWPQDRWEWYRARPSVPPCPDLSRFSQPAVCSSTVLFLASASVFACYAFRHVRFQAHEGLSASVQWYLLPG